MCSSSHLLLSNYKSHFSLFLRHTHFLLSRSSSSPILPRLSNSNSCSLDPPAACFLLCSAFRFQQSSSSMASASDPKSIYDFIVKDARGNDVELSQYKGKLLLIVNVASQCGFTNSNYTQLSQLYPKYKDQGLEILAFPCNQFGRQEPGTNDEIVEFACTRFKAEFPIFDKVDVNGEKAAPVYKFLKSRKGGILGDGIKWNFTKFLVDKDGNVVERYAPTTSPSSIEKNIKKLLGVA